MASPPPVSDRCLKRFGQLKLEADQAPASNKTFDSGECSAMRCKSRSDDPQPV